MNQKFLNQAAVIAIAGFNGVFVYPQLRQMHRRYCQMNVKATHFVSPNTHLPINTYIYSIQCFFDVEIDGKHAGRLDFELFGEKAPKTVNNFLAMSSGEYNRYMCFKGSTFHEVRSERWIKGGDITKRDGTGSQSVYKKPRFEAESNNLKFSEPYLLVASADDEGQVGSQFFITL